MDKTFDFGSFKDDHEEEQMRQANLDVAKHLKMFYDGLIAVGFTVDQAMRLTEGRNMTIFQMLLNSSSKGEAS